MNVPAVVRRRLSPSGGNAWRGSWLVTALITTIALVLRLIGLTHPRGMVFDEVYYAVEARALREHGYEFKDGAAEFVVHPPLGKWLIALGEMVFGYDATGWRIASVLAGTLSVVLVVRVAGRMFGSTVLAGTAGLLVALDGAQFVMSRVALLDVFLMLFVLAGFACLVADRDQRRARALAGARGGPPWWRLAAGVLVGCACAVKWSGVWYLVLYAGLLVWWDVGLRRTVGARPWTVRLLGWPAALTGTALVTYVASWTGWFATDGGYDRHWLAATGHREPPVLGALVNLWQYHREALHVSTTLTSPHPYQSWPWQWLLLGRPVLFYSDFTTHRCGAPSCASEVLLLGTPLLWWSFLPALAVLAWLAVARRDWRAAAVGLGAAAGIVPWFPYELDNRTMFYFYALPAEPFCVLAVVYVLGAIVGPAPGRDGVLTDRRLFGTVVAALYVGVVAITFLYFYPLYAGNVITYDQWWARIWLGNRWL